MTAKNFFSLALVVLIPLTFFVQGHFLTNRYIAGKEVPGCSWCEEDSREDVVYIPINATLMSLFAPADPNFLADLLWLRTTYYFGEHVLTDRQYPYLLHLIDLITDLSPLWKFPYFFGAVILPIEADAVDDGFYIIDKGLAYFPNEWELLFYKGFYLHQFKIDDLEASKLLHKASLLPGAPTHLARLAATLATKKGHQELALQFLQKALKNVKDEKKRKMLIQKIWEVTQNGGNSLE